jgi:hypothetical protein
MTRELSPEKNYSLETFWGSGVIKKGLVKNCKRCQPELNEVYLVAH